MSWAEELAYVLWSCIETTPLVIVPLLFAVLCVTKDRRPGRPLTALFAGVTLGFLLLVHGFAGTDPFHLWRYAFGFAIALTIALVLEAGAARGDDAANDVANDDDAIRLVPLGRRSCSRRSRCSSSSGAARSGAVRRARRDVREAAADRSSTRSPPPRRGRPLRGAAGRGLGRRARSRSCSTIRPT